MANLSPLTSQSPSKENDSIDEASAEKRKVAKSEDDFEDSLNVSISEHISEEIESNNDSSAIDDSIERAAHRFDQLATEKKNRLFDFDDSDRSDGGAVGADGLRAFSKFDASHLDESLSGDNIAKHFRVDVAAETSAQRSHVNEPATSFVSQRTIDANTKIADDNDGAAMPSTTIPTDAAAAAADAVVAESPKSIDEMHLTTSKDSSDVLVDLMPQSDGHKSVSDDKTPEKNDVILINDHEISIHSLIELQRQRSRSDILTQNTTSDISDLQNEDNNAKEQRSIDDLSINESSEKIESIGAEATSVDRSKSSSDKSNNSKSEEHEENAEESTKSDENVKKCRPVEEESQPELSIIEEVSAAESHSDKKNEMCKIIDDAVSKLPLDKENRPPNDDATSVASKYPTSSQNSTTTDGTVYTAFAKPAEPNFEDELNLNLMHLQNKIKELHNINAGKYSASFFDFQPMNSSRRDSLRDSFAPSGRDSSSITTNSTEYRPFQDDYPMLTDLQVALHERDKIIQELTDSLKQSIEIRDQLCKRNEELATETDQLKLENERRQQMKWITDRNFDEQRLSQTTIDLVAESDFEDDDFFKKTILPFQEAEHSGQAPKQTDDTKVSNPTIEEFKQSLDPKEIEIFAQVEQKFEELLNNKLNDIKEKLQQEQLERAELDSEANRLKHLLANVKSGSTEVTELRAELDKIHKKEMENLRLYFEQKCTDLEKQYSEEVFSQHSRRHSNDTNSDLSDDEIFQLEDSKNGGIRRASKTGEILASPTHRKLTPTHIRSTGSSPMKRIKRICEFRSLDGDKTDNSNTTDVHEHYQKVIAELKQSHEEKIKHLQYKLQTFEGPPADDEYLLTATTSTDQPLVLLTSETMKNNQDYTELFNNLVCEYDRRLEEQVKHAKEDMLHELEVQIQTLLSEPISDESRWPPELILLREKFTAKSQLEIAQLQIKHEEEMSRLKNDHQKQLDRKIKRHTDFDNGRSLEKTETERDNLRELCNTFRHLLYELAKCVSVCENDLNASLVDELNKHGILPSESPLVQFRSDSPANGNETDLNQSVCSSVGNRSVRLSLVPDVSGILSLIDDPSLLNFVNESETDSPNENTFNLNACLEKLKIEADTLLGLSEKLMMQKRITDNKEFEEAQKSLEEEDGLKIAKEDFNFENANLKPRLSLPTSVHDDLQRKPLSHSDLNDLKNRLVLAETKNQELEKKLAESLAQQQELTLKLNSYLDGQSEELSEGYGISQLRSPARHPVNKPVTSFSTLQERAKHYFNNTSASDVTQLLEDFCRECDRHVEEENQNTKDLQKQIEAAYNQRKQDLEFLEKQAAERETERDEFSKKIEKLESKLRDVQKERLRFENIAKESDLLRQQIHDIETELNDNKKTNASLQTDLKESIDKIYDLREIIVELEKQIKEKDNIVKSLENDIDYQKIANESMQSEMKSLLSQSEIAPTYEEKIQHLEEQLESLQPNADQSAAIERIAGHLREIEDNLDRKINVLESIHVGTGTVTACSSPSEDVSVRGSGNSLDAAISPRNFKYLARDPSFPVDQIQRIIEKMQKHSKVEEAAIKLVRDLEMQIKALHTSYMELQNERDLLKEKMDEQLMRITSIQTRLEEQRQRAEELQRAGTSDLNLKVYELQAEVNALKETISSRDKQISVLKSHLVQSKEIIDKQEAEIASYNSITDGNDTYSKLFVEKLESRIASKEQENKSLREKIRTEMITKVALPDLMETMLADKTEEIEYLKEQLEMREKELNTLRESQMFAKAEEKISEFFLKNAASELIDSDYVRNDSGTRLSLNPIKLSGTDVITPPLIPRQIDFRTKSTNDTESIQMPLLRSSHSSNESKNGSVDDGYESKAQLKDEIEYLKLSLEDKTKLVDEVTAESKKLKDELNIEKERLHTEIEMLNGQIEALQSKVEKIESELASTAKSYDKKSSEFESINSQLNEERANGVVMTQQLNSMKNTIKLKDELISKLQKDIGAQNETEKTNLDTINRLKQEISDLASSNGTKETDHLMENQKLREELAVAHRMLAASEQELSDKTLDYEKCLLDIKELEGKVFHLTDKLTDSKTARSVEELRIQIRTQQEENQRLKSEVDELKQRLSVERSKTPEIDEPEIDEITSRVEKELNYSAQLDSNILRAMEKSGGGIDSDDDDNANCIETIRAENRELIKAIEQLRNSLESERQKFTYLHQQDAKCIEEMTRRLEAALDSEHELNKLLEDERIKTSKLSTKMLEHQFERAKLSASNLSLNESPISSPRRLQKEQDQELLKCQNEEIRLIKSQLEREKERAADIDRSLSREKSRFEKEMSEQKAYGERMKDELERVFRENKTLQEELDDAQEKVTLSTRDIESLQSRIKQLQDVDAHRTARSEKDRTELAQSIATCRELKTRLINMERERDVLQERVSILQADIDRGAQREARLTDSLVAGYQHSNVISGGLLPQQLLTKLKEMNDNLSENVRENRQLSETLQMLTDERHVLQKKVNELEMICIDRDDLEERANHLFGKYLRTESFRRALIHQKRYLMIVVNTYECNEAKVISALNGTSLIPRKRKVPSFKAVALIVVAIERMKFILRRWQTGKRVCAKNVIFPHNTAPRRTHSASTINWTRNGTDGQIPNTLHHPQSPPIRERPMTSVLKGRRCTNNDFTTQI